jgi:L-fucose isomerase-like protein
MKFINSKKNQKSNKMTGIKLLSFKGASAKLFENGKNRLLEIFPGVDFDFNSEDPDILFFLSGGSEKEALKYSKPGKFLILAAFEENNSYAAATEVKAYFDSIGKDCLLIDLLCEDDRRLMEDYFEVEKAQYMLEGKRLGLIGKVSDWLVVSDISDKTLASRLGIELVKIAWNEVGNFEDFTPDRGFIETYKTDHEFNIDNAGSVHKMLEEIVSKKQLDAITVECFSLVRERSVTACLALSKLNDDGVAAGCEGDLASIAGMMIVKEVTGIIPWMANVIIVGIDNAKFAHCTAPTNLLSGFKIDSHYETGHGTSVRGQFKGDEITIFRLNNTMEKAFLTRGIIISRPQNENACRTQIEVKISENAAGLLKNKPLGNHHLIIPGNQTEKLRMFCKIKNICIVMD